MRAALLSPARITFRSLAGIARVRFVILASARLHREDNSARAAAPFSAVRFVLSDEATLPAWSSRGGGRCARSTPCLSAFSARCSCCHCGALLRVVARSLAFCLRQEANQ